MIAHRIAHWARTAPAKPAIIAGGQAYSYAAFAELIERARGGFSRGGLVGDGVVAFAGGSHLRFWIASLALRSLGLHTVFAPTFTILKSLGFTGLRAVVIGPGSPAPELTEYCARLGASVIDAAFDDGAPLRLDSPTAANRAGSQILMTSGTTGAYKQVLIDPAFEDRFLTSRARLGEVGEDSRVAVFNFPPSVGLGYKSAASAWHVGATVVSYQGPELHTPLAAPGLTHANLTPPLLDQMLAAPPGAYRFNPGLRVQIGGGGLRWDQVEQARARISPRLFAVVSSTEASTFARTPLLSPEDLRWHQPVPGRGVEIVDEDGRPTPIGQVGRLRVPTAGGPTGYFQDPATSAEFFRDGFFYPGDLALMREDGRFALHGRVTDVVNLRGHKLAPAPLEAALAEALDISGVCLFSLQDETGEEALHMIIEAPELPSTERLTAALGRHIKVKVKVRVHRLDGLPRNAMGKLLRRDAMRLALGSVAGA